LVVRHRNVPAGRRSQAATEKTESGNEAVHFEWEDARIDVLQARVIFERAHLRLAAFWAPIDTQALCFSQ
jgi:hypothetical protein